MTSVQGTFKACGDAFALTYTCTGPNCSSLNGLPNITCTTDSSGLSCSNGVACDSTSNYVSDFTLSQDKVLVQQSQNVNLGKCGSFVVTSDGTSAGTSSNVVDAGSDECASKGPGSSSSSATTSPSTISSSSDTMSSSHVVSTTSHVLTHTPSHTTIVSQGPAPPHTSIVSQGPAPPHGSVSSQGSVPSVSSQYGSVSSSSPGTAPSATTPNPPVFTGTASHRKPSVLAIICSLLMALSFLIPGAAASSEVAALLPIRAETVSSIVDAQQLNATSHRLMLKRAEDPKALADAWKEIADLLAEYVGGKLNTATHPDAELFAQNFVAEISNAICTHYAGKVVNAILGADLVEACTAAILTGAALEPPLELLAILVAGTECNFLVSYLFENLPLLSDVTAFINEVCTFPKPCGDLLTDPKNCGQCGNVCSTGVCKNGACTSNTCVGETCETFTSCGPGSTCVCASTAEGTGFCVDGQTPCAGLASCSVSAECGSGQICAVGSCCAGNVCVGASFCGGAATSPARLFAREYMNATIANPGVWFP